MSDLQALADEAMHEYGVKLTPFEGLPSADAIVAAVAHREHAALSATDFAQQLVDGGAVMDLKATFDATAITDARLRLCRL